MNTQQIIIILLIPFIGTVVGSAFVFFLKKEMPRQVRNTLMGFAAGVMVAASVWSLLIPSMEITADNGIMSVIPATIGFLLGIFFLLLLDKITPHQHLNTDQSEGPKCKWSRTSKLALAVTIHNVPEGIAIGIGIAGAIEGNIIMSIASALALAVGLAIQNIPEGAIVSMPLRDLGNSRLKSFSIGALSGIVEPIAALITIGISSLIIPAFPYMLAFGAGAMIYVVVEELIPESAEGPHSNLGTIGFAFGFVLMMILDVVLG